MSLPPETPEIVIRGNADPEVVAALTAVFAALDDSGGHTTPRTDSFWGSPRHRFELPVARSVSPFTRSGAARWSRFGRI